MDKFCYLLASSCNLGTKKLLITKYVTETEPFLQINRPKIWLLEPLEKVPRTFTH